MGLCVKCAGRVPRCGPTAAQDYLRPAAVAVGILTKQDIFDAEGKVTESIYRDQRGIPSPGSSGTTSGTP